MLDFEDLDDNSASSRMAGDGCFKCGECRFYVRDFRPSYGKPCSQRKIDENAEAPVCFVPEAARLARLSDFSFEQISMLVINLTNSQRRTFAHLLLNAHKCVSYAFMQKVWFAIGDPRYLKSWQFGYVLHAPKINRDRDSVDAMSAREGKVPHPTEITLIYPSGSGGMAFATMLHYSIHDRESFAKVCEKIKQSGLVSGPIKPGKLRGEEMLRQRDEARSKEEERKKKERNAIDADDMGDQDMWSGTSEFVPAGEDGFTRVGRGDNAMSVSRTTGKRLKKTDRNSRNAYSSTDIQDGKGMIFV